MKPEVRVVFQHLCGVLLPAWKKLPDGATLNLQDDPLDAALVVRPDLGEVLLQLSNELSVPLDQEQTLRIQKKYPDEFKAMKLLVCATYYQHSKVKSALEYHGQQALSLPRGSFGCEELVLKMMTGTKRYRVTGE